MNRSAKWLLIVTTTWMVLVWRIADDLPSSPNFLPAKFSHYMVLVKSQGYSNQSGRSGFGQFTIFKVKTIFHFTKAVDIEPKLDSKM